MKIHLLHVVFKQMNKVDYLIYNHLCIKGCVVFFSKSIVFQTTKKHGEGSTKIFKNITINKQNKWTNKFDITYSHLYPIVKKLTFVKACQLIMSIEYYYVGLKIY
jgi:hypothetical protein